MSEIYQLPDNNGGGFGSPSPSADFLKPKLEEDDNKEKEQVFAISAK